MKEASDIRRVRGVISSVFEDGRVTLQVEGIDGRYAWLRNKIIESTGMTLKSGMPVHVGIDGDQKIHDVVLVLP